MSLNRNPFKPFKYKWIWLTAIALFCIFLVLVIIHYSAPQKPELKLTSDNTFLGDQFELTGRVTADCKCDLSLTLNGDELTLDDEGKFSKLIDTSYISEEWDYELITISHGGLFNLFKEETTASGSFKRLSATVQMDPLINEWGDESIDFTLFGFPGAMVSVTAVSNYYALENPEDSHLELSVNTQSINSTGFVSILMPFENNERNQSTTYKIEAKLDGYTSFEKDFEIKNLAFNKEKIDEEIAKDRIMTSMLEPTNVGGTSLAILEGIKTDQRLGIYKVPDSNSTQYVSIPLFIYNTGYSSAHVNPNYVTIISGSRTYSYDSATYAWPLTFDAVDLQPNTYTSGYIVFVLPKDKHVFTLVYDNGYDLIKQEIYVE